MRVVLIDERDQPAFGPRIAAIERGVSYPLGADRFTIDHGLDYFAFFRRLGRARHYAAIDGERIAGVLGAVERDVGARRVTYLCDLKAAPGERSPASVLRPLFRAFARESTGVAIYGVSMDAADGANRLADLLARGESPLRRVATLRFFSLDAAQAEAAAPIVRAHRGPLGWLSLRGTKDLVMASTNAPMPLLHAQFGPCAEPAGSPRAGHVHMLCAPNGDPLHRALVSASFAPTAQASVLASGLEAADLAFILTSDI